MVHYAFPGGLLSAAHIGCALGFLVHIRYLWLQRLCSYTQGESRATHARSSHATSHDGRLSSASWSRSTELLGWTPRPKCPRDLLNPSHVSHRIFPLTPTTISRKPSVICPVHQPPHGHYTALCACGNPTTSRASLNCLINSLKRQPSAIIGSETARLELHSSHSVSDCI